MFACLLVMSAEFFKNIFIQAPTKLKIQFDFSHDLIN